MMTLFILCNFLSWNLSYEKIDTNFVQKSFEIGLGLNKNFGLSMHSYEYTNVNIKSPFTPYFTAGLSFQNDANYFFSIIGSFGYNAFSVSFNYVDQFNEFGTNINDNFILRNWISNIDFSASKWVKIKQKKLSIGLALSLTFQNFSRKSSSVTATDYSGNYIWLFDLDYENQKLFPKLSPKLLIEFEIMRAKGSANSLLFFTQCNLSSDKIAKGVFSYYQGNSEYKTGSLILENRYLIVGFRFRFGGM
jgi:hypothetical protein